MQAYKKSSVALAQKLDVKEQRLQLLLPSPFCAGAVDGAGG